MSSDIAVYGDVDGKVCLKVFREDIENQVPASEMRVDDIAFPQPDGSYMSLGSTVPTDQLILLPFVDYVKALIKEAKDGSDA